MRAPGGGGSWALASLAAVLLWATTPGAAPGRRQGRVPRVDPRAMAARWHTPTPGASAPLDASGRPKLVLRSINTDEVIELTAASDQGGFGADDLARATHLLRDTRSHEEHPVEPALLDLVYQAQRQFQAHEIRFVSSFRSPGRRGSGEHGHGRAIDLVVPGATDQAVVAWAEKQGFVGVGSYPRSGYVHLDVRASSYFWVDHGAPGQRSRDVPVRKREAAEADRAARERGQHPVLPYKKPAPDAPAGPAGGADPGVHG